jgi:hypothetical protein
MQKSYNIYYNLGYWFLLLILLVLAGFYSSYFLVFFQPSPLITHVHFTLMTLWIAMLIVQPFLIKYKKVAIHRKLGKVSYLLVPLVLVSGFLMIRLSYYRVLDDLHQKAAAGLNQFNNEQILKQAAAYEAIAFFWLFLCVVKFPGCSTSDGQPAAKPGLWWQRRIRTCRPILSIEHNIYSF